MTTIVKAANAAQFLSVVPRMLGFAPQRSVVLIPFEKARSLGAMRFDLPPAHEDPARPAATYLGIACRVPHADAIAVVIYDDDEDADTTPRRALVEALLARADDCGLRVTDALFVGTDAWGSYLDAECPAGGRPLTELHVVPDVAGDALPPLPTGDQSSGAELPATGTAAKERVAEALRSLGDAVELLCGADAATSPDTCRREPIDRAAISADAGTETDRRAADATETGGRRIDPTALVAVCALDDLPTLFEDALEWDAASPAPYDAAALIWCLSRPALRDIALVQWCSDIDGGDEALTAQLRWEAGEEYPAHLAMHMWGEGEQPDPGRLDAALELARAAASLAPDHARAGALATCAWLSWALGRSTHAERYAQQACEIEPEHGLAEIVLSFIGAGHLPDWAFHRRSTIRRPESHRIM